MPTTVVREQRSIEEMAQDVASRGHGLFQSRVTRDDVFKVLQREHRKLVRRRALGQWLHPEYVTDFVGTYETGFGNTDYQTYWSVLYGIDIIVRPRALVGGAA